MDPKLEMRDVQPVRLRQYSERTVLACPTYIECIELVFVLARLGGAHSSSTT